MPIAVRGRLSGNHNISLAGHSTSRTVGRPDPLKLPCPPIRTTFFARSEECSGRNSSTQYDACRIDRYALSFNRLRLRTAWGYLLPHINQTEVNKVDIAGELGTVFNTCPTLAGGQISVSTRQAFSQ